MNEKEGTAGHTWRAYRSISEGFTVYIQLLDAMFQEWACCNMPVAMSVTSLAEWNKRIIMQGAVNVSVLAYMVWGMLCMCGRWGGIWIHLTMNHTWTARRRATEVASLITPLSKNQRVQQWHLVLFQNLQHGHAVSCSEDDSKGKAVLQSKSSVHAW